MLISTKKLEQFSNKESVVLLNKSNAYFNLGWTLNARESIELLDKSIVTEKELFLKAIDLNPNSTAYLYLGYALEHGESIQLLNKTFVTL